MTNDTPFHNQLHQLQWGAGTRVRRTKPYPDEGIKALAQECVRRLVVSGELKDAGWAKWAGVEVRDAESR